MDLTKSLSLLLLTVCVASGLPHQKAMWDLGAMIVCAQPGINPLRYNEYGCWCGFGGSGPILDDVDACCKVHDFCYEAAGDLPECSGLAELPYIIDFDYSCSNKRVTCSASNDACQAAVCECDRAAAHCFAQYAFNSENSFVAASRCVG